MNTYTPFTITRKALVASLKSLLTDPAMRPFKDPKYGTKYPRLFLQDYAVYAVLRGADYRKTSHLEDGANAKEALASVAARLAYWVKNKDKLSSARLSKDTLVGRYLPPGLDDELACEALTEMVELINQAIAA